MRGPSQGILKVKMGASGKLSSATSVGRRGLSLRSRIEGRCCHLPTLSCSRFTSIRIHHPLSGTTYVALFNGLCIESFQFSRERRNLPGVMRCSGFTAISLHHPGSGTVRREIGRSVRMFHAKVGGGGLRCDGNQQEEDTADAD